MRKTFQLIVLMSLGLLAVACAPRYPVPSPLPTAAPAPPLVSPSANSGASRDNGVINTKVGGLDLVDVGNGVRSLSAELDNQRALATKDQKKLAKAAREKKVLTEAQIAKVLDPAAMTGQPHRE